MPALAAGAACPDALSFSLPLFISLPPSLSLFSCPAISAPTNPPPCILRQYITRIEEAKKRDHRNVGLQQGLFFFHQLS